MKKWEYIVVPRQAGHSTTEVEVFLNQKGQEGWELASIVADAYLVQVQHAFKREIPEPQPPNTPNESFPRLLHAD